MQDKIFKANIIVGTLKATKYAKIFPLKNFKLLSPKYIQYMYMCITSKDLYLTVSYYSTIDMGIAYGEHCNLLINCMCMHMQPNIWIT